MLMPHSKSFWSRANNLFSILSTDLFLTRATSADSVTKIGLQENPIFFSFPLMYQAIGLTFSFFARDTL